MKKPTIIKAARYWRSTSEWDVAVYWTHDPDKNPHDWDAVFNPPQWRKFSGLRSPKKNEIMKVKVTMEIVD